MKKYIIFLALFLYNYSAQAMEKNLDKKDIVKDITDAEQAHIDQPRHVNSFIDAFLCGKFKHIKSTPHYVAYPDYQSSTKLYRNFAVDISRIVDILNLNQEYETQIKSFTEDKPYLYSKCPFDFDNNTHNLSSEKTKLNLQRERLYAFSHNEDLDGLSEKEKVNIIENRKKLFEVVASAERAETIIDAQKLKLHAKTPKPLLEYIRELNAKKQDPNP